MKNTIRSNHTRQRLLDAAFSLLRDKGLAGATTREVAKRARLSEAALYVHFKNKQALFATLLRERLALPSLRIEIEADDRSTPEDVLASIVRDAISQLPEQLPLVSAVLSDPELARAIRRQPPNEGQLAGLASVVTYIETQQNRGTIGDTESPTVLARLLLAAAFHHAYLAQVLGEQYLHPKKIHWARAVARTIIAASHGAP